MSILKQITIKPVVSVIIPLYNSETTIQRTILSLLGQPNGKEIEIIIIDDGSTDASGTIADAFSKKHDTITVYHTTNHGLSVARNHGINKAHGKFIAFLDADDTWANGFFDSDLSTFLSKTDIDIQQFCYYDLSPNEKWCKKHIVKKSREKYKEHKKGRYNWYHLCSFMINYAFLLNNNLHFVEDQNVHEDRPFMEKCFFLANGCERHELLMFEYHNNQSSKTHIIDCKTRYYGLYQSFVEQQNWFSNFNVDYNIDYSIFMIFAQMLPWLCCESPYKEVISFINNEPSLEILKHWKDFKFHKSLNRTIQSWMTHPMIYYYKKRICFKPLIKLKRLSQNIKILRIIFDFIWYRIINKYETRIQI